MSFVVNVFSQDKISRLFVGQLWKEKNVYCFQYNIKYLKAANAISLGPDLALRKPAFRSKKLFVSLEDRIPSKNNPAYVDYCRQWNISPNETDKLVLLSTIGHRGPSSFLFRKNTEYIISGEELRIFRKELGLTVREFASFIDIEYSTFNKAESNNIKAIQLLKYCTLLRAVPQALRYQIEKRGQYLHDNKIQSVKEYIHQKLNIL